MTEQASLSNAERKFLVVLYRAKEHRLFSTEIMKEAGVGFSTVAAEQKRLIALGLLQKRIFKHFDSEMKVEKRMGYQLTLKGELIAIHLEHVSELLEGMEVSCTEKALVTGRIKSNAEKVGSGN